MQTIIWKNLSDSQKKDALARPPQGNDTSLLQKVAAILREVKESGDAALLEFSEKFDNVRLGALRVPLADIQAAPKSIDQKLWKALRQSKANIEKFHKSEYPKTMSMETMPGVKCSLLWRPIENVGIYIPAGTAPLYSALLMEAIPASIAKCRRVMLCTPPQKDGKVNPIILAAAQLCGITEIYSVGGAQAIAAMAYGTASIPKADKIFGPGNAWVTTAKQLVAQDPDGAAIDMPAGASEVLVLADKNARPAWVAADLLAQAEHGADSQVICVATNEKIIDLIKAEVERQLAELPRRAIAAESLKHARFIVAASLKEGIGISNLYAPEHLIIHSPKAEKLLPLVADAGSVFLGENSPESVGDYASGTNHVLPTNGYARAYAGLSVYSFMKSMTAQKLTRAGLKRIAPTVIAMAEGEGLDAHARAVNIRLGRLT